MTDAIQILVESSCVGPVVPLLRSALEAEMSLKYLTEEDYEHRSLVWNYYCLRKDERQYDPAKQDDDVKEFFGDFGPQAKAELAIIQHRIESGVYSDLHASLKSARVPKNWYHWVLDDNRKGLDDTVAALGRKVDQLHLYKVVYTGYSRTVHAGSHRYTHELRLPDGIEDYTLQAALLMILCIRLMIDKFVPSEIDTLEKWYKQIKNQMDEIEKLEADFNEAT